MTRILSLLAVVLAGTAAAAAQPTLIAPPPGRGPAARAHTRTCRHHGTAVRITRRTPDVMREDAARIARGDLFARWASAAAN